MICGQFGGMRMCRMQGEGLNVYGLVRAVWLMRWNPWSVIPQTILWVVHQIRHATHQHVAQHVRCGTPIVCFDDGGLQSAL